MKLIDRPFLIFLRHIPNPCKVTRKFFTREDIFKNCYIATEDFREGYFFVFLFYKFGNILLKYVPYLCWKSFPLLAIILAATNVKLIKRIELKRKEKKQDTNIPHWPIKFYQNRCTTLSYALFVRDPSFGQLLYFRCHRERWNEFDSPIYIHRTKRGNLVEEKKNK